MRPAASACKVGTRHTGCVVKTRRSSHSNRRVKYWAKLPVGPAKPAKPKKRSTIHRANKAKKARPMLKGGRSNVRLGQAGQVDVAVDGLTWNVQYDDNLVPMFVYTGDQAALQRGQPFPPRTGFINFRSNVAMGFGGLNYNPDDVGQVNVSRLPPRSAFQAALNQLRADV